MRSKINPRRARSLFLKSSDVIEAKRKMRETPQAKRYREEQEKFTRQILTAMDSAKTVEDLVYLEMALQEMDRDYAQTELENSSIDKAQRDYAEIVHAIEQMRTSPDAYLKANLSISSRDIMKMPDVRGPIKIRSNEARLQNRTMFATEEDRKVWDARIAAAHRTNSMLKELHKELVADSTQKD